MAFSLSQLTAPRGNRPLIATIVGEGGMGKTTLAASFPNPVFIRTEDGTLSLAGQNNVALFPVAKSSQEVIEQIHSLGNENHTFQTLVIDSITQLNTLIEHEIVEADGKAKSINQANGGYGAGYAAASERHRQIRELCGLLSEHKNMNVVFIAHADSETVDAPDQDAYTRYTIRMNKKSVSHYSDNLDLVAFIKLRTFTVGDPDQKKKAKSDGARIVTCYPTASHISKNRMGIKTDLDFVLGTNPFAQYLPQYVPQVAQAA